MPIAVVSLPVVTSGDNCFHLVSAATTNATLIKAGQGKVTGWAITNTNVAIRYFALHDIAQGPTAGQAVKFKFGIPATGAANISGLNLSFSRGIGISTVTGSPDNDVAAVTLGDLIINVFYL